MSLNENRYCEVQAPGRDAVIRDPFFLPANFVAQDGKVYNNVNQTNQWPDARLRDDLYLYLYVLLPDPGPPEPLPKKYNRTLSSYTITVSTVEQNWIYTEFTQEQYDLTASTTITESQRVATNLADQTERILQQNTYRNDAGKTPLIPPADLTDVQIYLGDLYDAMDDITGAVLPDEPPGATRQLTEVPGENVDRTVIRRNLVQFGGFDYWEIECTLYTEQDATGFSIYIQYQDGTFLFTLPLVNQGNGVWYATTDKNAGMANRDDFAFGFYKGKLISQVNDLPSATNTEAYPLYFDVRWLNGLNLQNQIRNI